MAFRKPAINEQIINLRQMDAATCQSLKGQLNEYGECLVDAQENPENPEVVVLKAMKYKKPGGHGVGGNPIQE